MAQKRVSVRFVAEGGRQVKAEFQGIGDAGENNFRRIERQADVTGAVVRRVMGVLGAAISTRQLVAYVDQWTDLRSRVDLATGSQEAGAAVMDRLASMARRTYSSLGQTTESWLANATALRELGLTTAESLDFTEALNNAMVVSGARAERAASVQNALSKAMALGTLSGDNLNTVIQSGGRLAELLASELGTTVSGLRGLGQQGAITGEVIRTALVGNLELLREEADSMPATIGDAFTLIGNAALQLVGTWDQVFGASSMVATALIAVADDMERLAAIGIAFATFMAGRWVTTTITTEGLPITSVGTVSHPTLAATNLAASMRRWRLTSAAVVDSVAEQRSAGWACWRGNAAGLGGWTFVTRISLTTLQATGMGFFGLYGSTAALATTLTLAAAINCIGIGFQRGTHTRWQLVTNDGTGAPTLTDMGASFGIATGGVLTLYVAAPPNGNSVWVRVVDEVFGAVFEQEITADLPANTQFLSPRLFMNNGATAAAVAYDCSGVYVETDL